MIKKIGIADGIFGCMYKPFIDAFLAELGLVPIYSVKSDDAILNEGSKICIDEVCLPIKLATGHIRKLYRESDIVIIPRIIKNEYGESICPKMCGLPELIIREWNCKNDNYFITDPMYLNDCKSIEMVLNKFGDKVGIAHDKIAEGYIKGKQAQKMTIRGIEENGYKHRVFLAGHPYNVYDEFANRWIVKKLHKMDIGIYTEERVAHYEKERIIRRDLTNKDLLKRPYWNNFVNIYGAAKVLTETSSIDGIVYISSFSCGIDSVVYTMLKNSIASVPLLLLKIDEQSGEAGYDTRLEAFAELIESRRRHISIN